MTAQGGCSELGLTVPSLSLEIIKVELSKKADLELFLGQPRLVDNKERKVVRSDHWLVFSE